MLLLRLALHIFERERERERERIEERDEKKKAKSEVGTIVVSLLYLYQNVMDVISKCVAGGNLGYVESRMCGGEKISNGQ